MADNKRELGEKIDAARDATQPMLLSIMERLGIALPVARASAGVGGADAGGPTDAMAVEEIPGAVSAGPGNGEGTGVGAAVVSNGRTERSGAAAAGSSAMVVRPAAPAGEACPEREPLGGLDFVIAESRRTEMALGKLRKRLIILDGEWKEAMEEEARALEALDVAEAAVVDCVEEDGVDRQALLFGAREDATDATEAVMVLAAKMTSAKGAVAQMETSTGGRARILVPRRTSGSGRRQRAATRRRRTRRRTARSGSRSRQRKAG